MLSEEVWHDHTSKRPGGRSQEPLASSPKPKAKADDKKLQLLGSMPFDKKCSPHTACQNRRECCRQAKAAKCLDHDVPNDQISIGPKTWVTMRNWRMILAVLGSSDPRPSHNSQSAAADLGGEVLEGEVLGED